MTPGAALRGVFRLFVPPQCAACHDRTDGAPLCPGCADEVGAASCSPAIVTAGEEPPFPVLSVAPYEAAWKSVVLSFKKDPVDGVTRLVVRRLRAALSAAGWLEGPPPTLVPVPMARVRRREKGFNPPERLASALGRELGWPVTSGALERVRYDGPLTGSGREERRARLSGAIRVRVRALGEPGEGAGRVLLVDDVLTTGATLEAAARALRAAGVSGLRAATLARAEASSRDPRKLLR